MNRVLLTTNPEAFMYHGGGEREILLLNDALNSSGLISDIYGPTSRTITAYKAVIHFSMSGGSEYIIKSAIDNNKHLILWPNIWFVKEPSIETIDHLSNFLNNFHTIVFRSFTEENHFRKYFDIEKKDIIRISYLISPNFFRKNISDVFRESYGFKPYAIWPGIIEPQKNQLSAILAFNKADMDLYISGECRDSEYIEICKNKSMNNIHFIPSMPFCSEIHLSALKYSSLFVELPLDFPGTSALEAAAMGCKLLVPNSNWADEMLGEQCTQVDIDNTDSIINTIKIAISNPNKNEGNCTNNRTHTNVLDSITPLVQYILSL